MNLWTQKTNQIVTQEDIMNLLDSCYEKCLNGIPAVSVSVDKMAADYQKSTRIKKKLVKLCYIIKLLNVLHLVH